MREPPAELKDSSSVVDRVTSSISLFLLVIQTGIRTVVQKPGPDVINGYSTIDSNKIYLYHFVITIL